VIFTYNDRCREKAITGFKMLCGEPYLLRNLVKLGYDQEDTVKNEIACVLNGIKEDGGFGCSSTNKRINDPGKPHKSCARLTVEYLLLVAELHLLGYRTDCESKLVTRLRKQVYRELDLTETETTEKNRSNASGHQN